MRTLAFVLTAVMCASFAHDQPVSCNDDAQCHADYFCETAIHFCQKCLHCEDFKRELPTGSPSSCIKSVVECGSCLQGLVVDHRGDVNGECVTPADPAAEGSLPVYIWSIIGFIALGVFIAMIIIILYVMRRMEWFKISSATLLRSSCTSTSVHASAPADPPPPYNPYSPVRADSPIGMPDVAYSPPMPTDEETSHPFIKRVPTNGPQSAREAAGSQNARVYDPPAYVRLPQGQTPFNKTEESNNWPSIHNEDTTPHDWTPNSSTNDDNGNVTVTEIVETPESTASEAMSSDLPSLLAAARETTLVAPPAKKMKTQDSNNNGNRGATSADFVGPSTAHATKQPSIVLNIVQINNTKL